MLSLVTNIKTAKSLGTLRRRPSKRHLKRLELSHILIARAGKQMRA
jgi:hypothetical protein